MSVLDGERRLVSKLWFDQPDAHERIEAMLLDGSLAYEEATRLHAFVDHGYLTLRLSDAAARAEAFGAGIEDLWHRRPDDVLAAGRGYDHYLRLSQCPEAWREEGCRLADLQSNFPAALDLYLEPAIFRYVELLFGEPALAFQSLYFRHGSEQALHRDPMYVVTDPASHLLAAWIALEDIPGDCGPLFLVPGSHRMPWYEFEPGEVRVSSDTGTPEHYRGYSEHVERHIASMGLSPRRFVCKQGEVLLWHGALLHGGVAIDRPGSTRRSFVVHYSTLASYRSRRIDFRDLVDGEERPAFAQTDRVVSRGSLHGLASPLVEPSAQSPPPAGAGAPEPPAARGWRERLGLRRA